MANFYNKIELKLLCDGLGFLDCGAAAISDVGEDRLYYEKYLAEGCNASMGYLERNLEKRFNPALLVEGAQSILCFLAPYGGRYYDRQNPGCRVASFAHGLDYHDVVKARLRIVMQRLGAESERIGLTTEPFSGRAFVDSAPVLERRWAAAAGLGFIGLNNFLISPDFGLRTIIGVIICNIPAEAFKKHPPLIADDCGACGRCIASCPCGALNDDGEGRHWLDARRCISYNTIESKELPQKHPVEYEGRIFGCEECIAACPWDRDDIASWSEFEENAEVLASMTPQEWLSMSEEDFSSRFSGTSLQRAGLEKLKNNIKQ